MAPALPSPYCLSPNPQSLIPNLIPNPGKANLFQVEERPFDFPGGAKHYLVLSRIQGHLADLGALVIVPRTGAGNRPGQARFADLEQIGIAGGIVGAGPFQPDRKLPGFADKHRPDGSIFGTGP